ncbi:Sigma-70 region 2 [gut metagenome]|uniref:Sigma-70 region 2 n=1 Tax=gut metagenome TaxID=749906 RepID=J9FZL4_9ZZZZ
MTAQEETLILTTLREDTEKGFRMLLTRFQEPLYWHIRRLLVSHDDTQDATQETFVRIYRSWSQFKGESSLAVWMYRIATNEALRLLRQRKEETLSLDDPEVHVGHLLTDEYVDYTDLEAVKLQQAILSLPTKQQLAFNLRYYDELDYDAIAQITESTAVNVKANYHLAKEKIIQYMNMVD